MIASHETNSVGLEWGTAWHVWACRLSQALGLMVVLAVLLLIGWAP